MIELLTAVIIAASSTAAAPATVELVASAGENVEGLALSSPQGLAINPRSEEFLVADGLNHRVVIFDTTGAVVFTFALGRNRYNPFGIAVNSRDEVIVSPMDSPKLWIYDYNGQFLDEISLPQGVLPGRLITDPKDNIYLVDRAGRDILLIDESGNLVKKLESPRSDCKPAGVCFDEDGNVVLTSAAGEVITAFGRDGRIVYSFGVHGRQLEDFSHPTSCAVDASGWLWVLDSFRHHIKRFDKGRKFVDVVGQRGLGPGEFYFPVDLKITPGGRLGVLEKGSGRLQIFRLSDAK